MRAILESGGRDGNLLLQSTYQPDRLQGTVDNQARIAFLLARIRQIVVDTMRIPGQG
jgi:hypothetical protein